MSFSDFSLHGCKSITVKTHLPHNGNCIRLQITCRSGQFHYNERGECVEGETSTDLILFDLPTDVTDHLKAVFGENAEQAQAAE